MGGCTKTESISSLFKPAPLNLLWLLTQNPVTTKSSNTAICLTQVQDSYFSNVNYITTSIFMMTLWDAICLLYWIEQKQWLKLVTSAKQKCETKGKKGNRPKPYSKVIFAMQLCTHKIKMPVTENILHEAVQTSGCLLFYETKWKVCIQHLCQVLELKGKEADVFQGTQ